MTSHLRRRALLAAAVFTSTALVAGATSIAPAVAQEVQTPMTCRSDALEGTLELDFSIDITPTSAYVGRTATPTMVLKATIPGDIVWLAAFFGVKSASAVGTFNVGIDGANNPTPFVFPRTDIPQTAQDYTATVTMGLPDVARTSPGSLTYTPGPVAISLTGYNKKTAEAQEGDEVGTIDAECTSQAPDQSIGSIAFVKSPTAIASSASYAKRLKKVTAVTKVVAKSGVQARGVITAVLYRGKAKVKTVRATLSGGRATVAFKGVKKKGRYKVVTRYAGSPAHQPSVKVRYLQVR